MNGFAALHRLFPHFDADYTPPWGLPKRADFERIHAAHGVQYPAAFVEFQCEWAQRLPTFPQGFRWANPGLEPYASLDSLIVDAGSLGLTGFAPFADDDGDFIGFLASHPGHSAGASVVRYELADERFYAEAKDFIDWLLQQYQRHMPMIADGSS